MVGIFITMENIEIWKDIPNYEGMYQVSNLGNVKSLSRVILKKGKYPFLSKEKIIKQCVSKGGYYVFVMTKNRKQKLIQTHQVVAQCFLNHTICGMKLVVNHKDFNKLNNNVNNLEIVTQRENASHKQKTSSSKYIGVSFNKKAKKYVSYIYINKKLIHLGTYNKEIDAHLAYQNKLKEIL